MYITDRSSNMILNATLSAASDTPLDELKIQEPVNVHYKQSNRNSNTNNPFMLISFFLYRFENVWYQIREM